VESLDRGAVEVWLVRMLNAAHVFGRTVDWTFYCTHPVPGRLDEEAIRLGAKEDKVRSQHQLRDVATRPQECEPIRKTERLVSRCSHRQKCLAKDPSFPGS
jgi:hypothetical protein